MTNNAINSNIPIEVTKGGTQASSFVAYAPIVGGVTSTGALQSVASAGTTGQVLVSQGNAALPIWAASTGFTSINVQKITANGTYTPSAGMVQCIVEVLAAGGGGRSCSATTSGNGSAGGGGGAGEYRRGLYTASQITTASPITITIGTGGVANTDGTDTVFGSLITAKGGKASTIVPGSNDTAVVDGGFGGTGGSGGDFDVQGSSGQVGMNIKTNVAETAAAGDGGNSQYGAGGLGFSSFSGTPVQGNGGNAQGFGSGGGGAGSLEGGTAATGGTGAPGLIVVTEFIA